MNIHGDFAELFNKKRRIKELNNSLQNKLMVGIFIICAIGIIGQWID